MGGHMYAHIEFVNSEHCLFTNEFLVRLRSIEHQISFHRRKQLFQLRFGVLKIVFYLVCFVCVGLLVQLMCNPWISKYKTLTLWLKLSTIWLIFVEFWYKSRWCRLISFSGSAQKTSHAFKDMLKIRIKITSNFFPKLRPNFEMSNFYQNSSVGPWNLTSHY